MKQYPSRLKYKKNHKPSSFLLYSEEKKNFNAIKGSLVLKSLENCRLNYNQIEACRKSIRRILKKKGIIIIRLFTNISLTKKPIASRMGSGKGNHSY
jgi:large subunit ribosomal protein L16